MSYTVRNFKTKKELKEAVGAFMAYEGRGNEAKEIAKHKGIDPVRCYNPGIGPNLSNWTGSVYLEGPHYPEPHKWYAKTRVLKQCL